MLRSDGRFGFGPGKLLLTQAYRISGLQHKVLLWNTDVCKRGRKAPDSRVCNN